MKKFSIIMCFLFVCSVLFGLSSCFSLMKADRMVYAGSLGKKADVLLIDSLYNIRTQSETK